MTKPQPRSLDSTVFSATEVANVELLDAPIPPSWITSGTPRARSGAIVNSPDGWASSVVWECSAGSFRWQFGWEETVVILEGSVRVTVESGEERLLLPGDAAYFAQGTSALWQIDSRVKKIAFIRNRVPAYIRKPIERLRSVRNAARGLPESFQRLNAFRKLVMAALGLGGSFALMNAVFEI